jgi:hypothetical protein
VAKYKKAVKGEEESRIAFEELDASVDDTSSQEWTREEREAMEFRGEYLRIYKVQIDKGKFFIFLLRPIW